MNKLLVICGPTSTGKTRFALHLAKKFNGELVSADSRQVYTGMDIGTGKDLGERFKFELSDIYYRSTRIGYYTDGQICIWGYDLVDPHEEFSVSLYIAIVRMIVEDITRRGKLPIIVGGTGLYIKALLDGIETSSVPPNSELRKSMANKSVEELFELLAPMDPIRAASLNPSDRKNPRRLIRALELVANPKVKVKTQQGLSNDYSLLMLGFSLEKDKLYKLVEKRIRDRVENGFESEVQRLVNEGVPWDAQSMSSLGYKQWQKVLEKGESVDKAISEWEKGEKKYAKRQMTWFKKDKKIVWFDTSRKNVLRNVEHTVEKWYKQVE